MVQTDPMDDPVIRDFMQESEGKREVSYDDIVNSVDDHKLPVLGDNRVALPGGVITPEGLVIQSAVVRELTGYDEEELARSDVKEPIDYITKLVSLGVKEIGGKPMTDMTLRSLLVGDRNALVLGIRRATFGNELNMEGLTCPGCDTKFDLIVELDEFEEKILNDPLHDRVFNVSLMHTSAKVRIPTHGDIMDMLKASKKANEQNTSLLAHCLLELGGKPIAENPNGDAEQLVKSLSMRDRALLIKELDEHQPGPDLSGVKISCPSCDYEDTIVLDLISLFRL